MPIFKKFTLFLYPLIFVGVFLSAMAFSAAVAEAATYYVATTGNNSNPGTLAQPWRTLTYAESRLSPGDTVLVRGGTYNETFTINVNNVTFKNYSGETPVVAGNYVVGIAPANIYVEVILVTGNGVTVDGFEVKNEAEGIHVNNSDGTTIRNCHVHTTYSNGVVVSRSPNSIIEYNQIHDNGHAGSSVAAMILNLSSHNSIIRHNKIYDSDFEGLDVGYFVDNVIVEYNEIYGNKRLQVYPHNSNNVTVRYNLIYGTDHGKGIGIWLGHETYPYNPPDAPRYPTGNHKVYGNLVANCYINFFIEGRPDNATVVNSEIYNNTFIENSNNTVANVTIFQYGGGHIFKNNIIWQTGGAITNNVPGGTITGNNNLWSRQPDADIRGANDLPYGIPNIAKTTGWNTLTGGQLNGTEFNLQATSPAINAGANLGALYNILLDAGASNFNANTFSILDQNANGAWEIGGDVY